MTHTATTTNNTNMKASATTLARAVNALMEREDKAVALSAAIVIVAATFRRAMPVTAANVLWLIDNVRKKVEE